MGPLTKAALLLALATVTARADDLGRHRGVGMTWQDEYVHVRPGTDGRVGIGIGVHLGRYWRSLQWRGEVAGAVASPGGGNDRMQVLRLGGAVRIAALSKAIRSLRTLGMSANVDLGAGCLWYGDAQGPLRRPYAAIGVAGAMVLQDPHAVGPDGALSFALVSRFTIVDGGWAITGGLEMEWGR